MAYWTVILIFYEYSKIHLTKRMHSQKVLYKGFRLTSVRLNRVELVFYRKVGNEVVWVFLRGDQ
jgi:hypothetical protein